MVFTWRMVLEVVQPFWAALQRGEFITDAAEGVGTYRKKGARWMAAECGVRPRRGRDLLGRYLSFSEREEIALARAGGEERVGEPEGLVGLVGVCSNSGWALSSMAHIPGQVGCTAADAWSVGRLAAGLVAEAKPARRCWLELDDGL